MLTTGLATSPPTSLSQSTPPVPHYSPHSAPITPASTNHGQATSDDQTESFNELMFHGGDPGGNGLVDDECTDFSISPDTTDEELEETSTSDSDGDDTSNDGTDCSDGADHPGFHPDIADDEERDLNHGEREGTVVEPTIVDFPGKRAGEVCSEGIMSMQEYENALGGPHENPYHPFASGVDWDLAKWAKLRGPSATSFTELLNISGVSVIPRPSHLAVSHLHLAVRAIKSILYKFKRIE